MINTKVREIANRRNIKTAYQLQQLTGWTPGMCARIWKGEWRRLDLNTLNTLCNVLECTPNDLLVFKRDRHFLP